MNSQTVEGACAFAWRNYLLVHSGVSENDSRRADLHRYILNLCDTGEYDFGILQTAAVAYLKKLDELHDDGGARLAADQALTACLGSRGASGSFHHTRAKGANSMTDKSINDANSFAREQQSGITVATAIGLNTLKPIIHLQVSMLRMWADSIERFAGKYEKGLENTAAAVEERSDKERAA